MQTATRTPPTDRPRTDPTPPTDRPRTDPTPRAGHVRAGRRAAAAVALAAAGVLAAACSSAPAATPAGPTITISNFAFRPATLTVHPGAHVRVANTDTVAHTLTARSGAFDTGLIQPGQSVTIIAPSADGTYPYYCSVHQYMSGVLVVSG